MITGREAARDDHWVQIASTTVKVNRHRPHPGKVQCDGHHAPFAAVLRDLLGEASIQDEFVHSEVHRVTCIPELLQQLEGAVDTLVVAGSADQRHVALIVELGREARELQRELLPAVLHREVHEAPIHDRRA